MGLPGKARVCPTSHSDCASVTGASKTIRWSLISTTRLLCDPPCTWCTPGAISCRRSPCEPRVVAGVVRIQVHADELAAQHPLVGHVAHRRLRRGAHSAGIAGARVDGRVDLHVGEIRVGDRAAVHLGLARHRESSRRRHRASWRTRRRSYVAPDVVVVERAHARRQAGAGSNATRKPSKENAGMPLMSAAGCTRSGLRCIAEHQRSCRRGEARAAWPRGVGRTSNAPAGSSSGSARCGRCCPRRARSPLRA